MIPSDVSDHVYAPGEAKTFLFEQVRTIWVPTQNGIALGCLTGVLIGVVGASFAPGEDSSSSTLIFLLITAASSAFVARMALDIGRQVENSLYSGMSPETVEDRSMTLPWVPILGGIASCIITQMLALVVSEIKMWNSSRIREM
eukprot:jgi/Bigna1/59901/fgenesh1_kg.7_\